MVRSSYHAANFTPEADVLEAINEDLRKDYPTPYDIPAWHHGDTALPDELSVIYHNWDEIRRLMWDCLLYTSRRKKR